MSNTKGIAVFKKGDLVRLISDEYRIGGMYGTSFKKYLSEKELENVLEYRKNDLCVVMRLIESGFIGIAQNLNPDVTKYNLYPIIVHIADIERIKK